MAFEFSSPTSIAGIEQDGECIFDLPRRYGVPASYLARIGSGDFYRSTVIEFGALPTFLTEVERLLELRRREIEPTTRRQKRLHPKTLATQPDLLERFLREDPAYRTLTDIVRVVHECLDAGAAMHCDGD